MIEKSQQLFLVKLPKIGLSVWDTKAFVNPSLLPVWH